MYDFQPIAEEEDENGTFQYKVNTNHPRYIYNKKYEGDIRKINAYFIEKKFNKKIGISDLESLDIENISKTDILELYNNAISSEKITKWGNNPILNHSSYLNKSLARDDYTWKLGYIIQYGKINYISIELMIGDDYLSDIINSNEASDLQKELFKDIQEIKKYIIENQKFELPKSLKERRPYNCLYENINDIKALE